MALYRCLLEMHTGILTPCVPRHTEAHTPQFVLTERAAKIHGESSDTAAMSTLVPVCKKDSSLLLYAPPSSDASGWHPCFPTTLRAEGWDPGIKTLAAIRTLFALALLCAAFAYGGVITGKA